MKNSLAATPDLRARTHSILFSIRRRTMNWSEVFTVGSPWFWLLLAGEAATLIALIEWGKGWLATLSLVSTLALLQFLGDANVLAFVNHHPLLLGFGVVGYFAVGTVWSVMRWWLFVHDQRNRYDEARLEFCQEHNLDGTIPEHLHQEWQEQLINRKRRIEIRPKAIKHKSRILMWMAYWPGSMFWTILNDPVRKACRFIYRHIHDYLQEISDNAFKGIEADLPKQTDPRVVAMPLIGPVESKEIATAAVSERQV
jgi:hypothetical protein